MKKKSKVKVQKVQQRVRKMMKIYQVYNGCQAMWFQKIN